MSGRPRTTSFAESCKPVPQPSAFGSMKVSSKYGPVLLAPCFYRQSPTSKPGSPSLRPDRLHICSESLCVGPGLRGPGPG
jgi:hypothetical protein